MKFSRVLRRVFGSQSEPETKAPDAPPRKPSIEEMAITDSAALKLFESFGAPESKIRKTGAHDHFKTWFTEIEINEAIEKINDGLVAPELAQIIMQTIEAFTENQNFEEYRSNFYTVGYTHKIATHLPNENIHILSVGCPMSMNGAPRYIMELVKRGTSNHNNTVWMQTERRSEAGNTPVVMLSAIPSNFKGIGLAFFRHVLSQYPENGRQVNPEAATFPIGGMYGPSGILG